MFIRKIIDFFLMNKSKSFYGVEYTLTEEGNTINYAFIQKKGDSLEIIDSAEKISLKEFLDIYISTTPVFIVVNGKGTLHKKIKNEASALDSQLLQKVLPNADASNYHYSVYELSDSGLLVSLIRKEIFDKIILEWATINVVQYHLGPSIAAVLGDAYHLNKDIVIGAETFVFKNGTLLDWYKNESSTEFNAKNISIDVNPNVLIAYSSGLNYYIGDQSGIEVPNISYAYDELKRKIVFQKTLVFSSICLFLILLVNFIFFSHYYSKKEVLATESFQGQNQLTLLDTLRVDYEYKKKFLIESGFLNSSKLSYYADQLAIDVPINIVLSKVMINPLLQDKIEENILNFDSGFILINGYSNNTTTVDAWVKILQQKTWVEKVEIINLGQDKEDNQVYFEIKIKCLEI